MPNWCNNTLIVEGNVEDLQKIKSLLINDKGEFSFNCAVPQPDNLYQDSLSSDKEMELNAKGIPNWYNWTKSYWGTKWDACYSDVDVDDDNEIRINFQTAWSPPSDWLYGFFKKLEGIEVSVQLLYDEPGMDFAGSIVREMDGEVYEYQGRIYQVDYSGNEVFYNSKECRYRNAKGQFVSEDEITYEVEYGN
jgi:hypothetical protein